jgi:hypothetical protein
MIEKSRASEMPGTMFYISSNSWYIIITMFDNSMTITVITLIITMYYVSIYLKKHTHIMLFWAFLKRSPRITKGHHQRVASSSGRRCVQRLRNSPWYWPQLDPHEIGWKMFRCDIYIYIWCIYGWYMFLYMVYMNYIGFIYGLYIFLYSLYDMVVMASMIDVRGFLMICKYIYSFDMIWYIYIYNYINYYFYCYKRACFRI